MARSFPCVAWCDQELVVPGRPNTPAWFAAVARAALTRMLDGGQGISPCPSRPYGDRRGQCQPRLQREAGIPANSNAHCRLACLAESFGAQWGSSARLPARVAKAPEAPDDKALNAMFTVD
ncbi:MAG: hypothetical protein R3E84_18600 [Pseudomonadales bacterium]